MVGATGIEPVTPAVYGGMPKGDPAIEMVIREVMTTMLDAQQDVPRDWSKTYGGDGPRAIPPMEEPCRTAPGSSAYFLDSN